MIRGLDIYSAIQPRARRALDHLVHDHGHYQRGGHLPQERVVARKLDPNRLVLAASPQYLRTVGTPRTLDDLRSHRALMYRGPHAVLKWLGRDEEGWREIPATPAFISNDGTSLVAMACRHRGLVLLSEWGLKDYLARGELTEVTLDRPVSLSRVDEMGIYLLYLQTRYRVPKVRVAVEFLVKRLQTS